MISETLRALAGIAAFATVFATAGCTSAPMGGGGASGGRAAETEIYPAGVLTTPSARGAIRGIFAVDGAAEAQCCWVEGEARFLIAADNDATTLRITFYQPGYRGLEGQTVSVIDPKGKVIFSRKAAAGLQTLSAPIPPKTVHDGLAAVHLRMSRTFVPREIGLNSDPRHLALILREVTAR